MKSVLFIVAILFASPFLALSSQAHQVIHDLMEDEIGPAFKVIATDLKAGRITAQTKQAGHALLNGFTALLNETPNEAANGSGGTRPITQEEIAIFKKMNSEILDLAKVLVPQLDGDDVAGAKATVMKIVDIRRQAHELFKAD